MTMSLSKRQYFSGNTIEQAVVAAACHYHVDPDRLAYRQVEKRHGFVKIRRRVVIEVDPENLLRPEAEVARKDAPGEPRRERPLPPERRSADEPRHHPTAQPVPPATAGTGDRPGADRSPPREERLPAETRSGPGEEPVSPERLVEGAQEAVDRILRLAKLDLRAAVTWVDDRLEVDLTGPDRDRLLDEEGEVLQAVEYLVPRVMRGRVGESAACRVDSGNFRRDREAELAELARRTADAVRERGRPIALEPMNPTERRAVHLALAEDPEVTTESEGEGYFKQVVVKRA